MLGGKRGLRLDWVGWANALVGRQIWRVAEEIWNAVEVLCVCVGVLR